MSFQIPNDLFVNMLEYSTLNPATTAQRVSHAAEYAMSIKAKSYCTYPQLLAPVSEILEGSETVPVAVIGFPFGLATPSAKAVEAQYALDQGAKELNVVMNIATFRAGLYVNIEEEFSSVAKVAHNGGAKVKVIIETYYWNAKEIYLVCVLAEQAGVDFIVTCTGVAPTGIDWLKTRLMLMAVEGRVGVMAAGGLETRQDVEQYLQLGCVRVSIDSHVKDLLNE
jgi:deoxyribose-phosphate aldolase